MKQQELFPDSGEPERVRRLRPRPRQRGARVTPSLFPEPMQFIHDEVRFEGSWEVAQQLVSEWWTVYCREPRRMYVGSSSS